MPVRQTVGYRNNNPGNIKFSAKNKWNGQTGSAGPFATFEDPIYGVRALALLLLKYYDKYDCHTVFDIISRYAPPGTDNNPTTKYAAFVAKAIDASPHDEVDMHDYATMRGVVDAIIAFENGQPNLLTEAQMVRALTMAGFKTKEERPVIASRTGKAATVSTASGSAGLAFAGLSDQLRDLGDQLSQYAQYSKYIAGVCATITIVSAIYIIYVKRDDIRKGVG